MRDLVRIDPGAYVLGALLLLTVPLDWLLSALLAAAVHELCHLLAIRLLGGNFYGLRIGPGGAVMDARLPEGWGEALCALAGPAGSFFLILLCRRFPKLALCALFHGAFNLLPIYPLDGGRILSCLLDMYLPKYANCILKATKITLISLFCALTGHFFTKGILSGFFLVLTVFMILGGILRKRPCKRSQIRVQ